ncbi:helix-turn-helix domain-containing protein [Ensifer sp. 4252]|uniref:helix-turn-helix domain-containing protein n=1 Tax=Ensifer sp. 4252 TaxID=3373915 RepID=UPI003D1A4232
MNRSPAPAISSHDSLGCRISQLEEERRIDGAGITFHRKKATTAPVEVCTPACDRGFLLGLSLASGHRRRIFHEHHSTVHDFAEHAVYLRNFQDPYRAELTGSFDFFLMEIGQDAVERVADSADLVGVTELQASGNEPDPVLAGLAGALFAATVDSSGLSALLVDQLSVAIGIHVTQRYGNARQGASASVRSKGRRISSRSLRTIQDMMHDRLDDDLTIGELALVCNISQAVFLRAFRETTGTTPYQFLTQARVNRARDLLVSSPLPIAEIAMACGFADQSHFTRVFSRVVGTTPAYWRRNQR